jgi:hypothetical protein
MHRSIYTGLCALGLFATEASAQRYSIRKPPAILDEVSVGATVLSPCDVSIQNLGNILDVYNFTNGIYNDATVLADSTAGTKSDDSKTYNFAYVSLYQLCDDKGNPSYMGEYLKATSVKAEAKTGTFSENGDSGIMQGMDFTYTHYFTRKHSYGVVLGMSTNGFSFKRSADWDAVVTTRSDLYKAEGLAGLDSFTGSSTRPRIFTSSNPEAYLYYKNPISLGETVLSKEVTASGAWDLKTAFVNFHLGGAYNVMLSRHFVMRMSGGLALVSASSRFRWDESYTVTQVPTIDSDTAIEVSGTNYKHKFLIGGWADLGANYRINRIMSVYSALQYQATDSLDQTTSMGHYIKLDCGSLYSLKTGFSWAF